MTLFRRACKNHKLQLIKNVKYGKSRYFTYNLT